MSFPRRSHTDFAAKRKTVLARVPLCDEIVAIFSTTIHFFATPTGSPSLSLSLSLSSLSRFWETPVP
jgi:hypothetical protein